MMLAGEAVVGGTEISTAFFTSRTTSLAASASSNSGISSSAHKTLINANRRA
jgi:hypothetical protein